MPPITSYQDLEVWQCSIELIERCYALTACFPRNEQFVLGNQIRRAAVSVSANIAEGHRRPVRAYLNHLSIALGSLAELETELEISRRLGFLKDSEGSDALSLLQSVGKLLHALRGSLERL